MSPPTITREQAIRNAAQVLARWRARTATLTDEQIVEEAYIPGGPSREVLLAKVRALRAKSPRRAAA